MVRIRPAEAGRLRQHRGGRGHIAGEHAQQSDLPRGRFGTTSQRSDGLRSKRHLIAPVDREPP
jgi:hypothetical protein